MSHVPERRQVFGTLSVIDNLELGAYHRYRKEPRKTIADDLARVLTLFPVLKQRCQQNAGTLSGGEQQMLALGRGLMARPKLLLLDEPSLGLAPLIVREIMRTIAALRDRGATILLVEQNTKAALSIADRGYVMETGKIVSHGTAAELLRDERVRAAYLGKGRQRVRH
jgi:branched-chain amino acid transport system ATP-binding protein